MTELLTLKGNSSDALPEVIKNPPSMVCLPDEFRTFCVLMSFAVNALLVYQREPPGIGNHGALMAHYTRLIALVMRT